jgi:hypothetical protein
MAWFAAKALLIAAADLIHSSAIVRALLTFSKELSKKLKGARDPVRFDAARD